MPKMDVVCENIMKAYMASRNGSHLFLYLYFSGTE
jgi:hypothetical protein